MRYLYKLYILSIFPCYYKYHTNFLTTAPICHHLFITLFAYPFHPAVRKKYTSKDILAT